MDKRVVRTKKAIRSVYLTLRDKTRLEKIRVSDICELAEINKTTFYKYYSDIFDLNNEICDSIIAQIWESFEERDCLLNDTVRFITELPAAVDAQGDIVRILFHDRNEDFFKRLEALLTERYVTDDMPRNVQLRLLFGIRGLVRMFAEIKKQGAFTPAELAECASPLFALTETEASI